MTIRSRAPISSAMTRLMFGDEPPAWLTRRRRTAPGETPPLRPCQAPDFETSEELLQSAKMSALGVITAGIVHEINTPLAYVSATFNMLERRMVKITDRLTNGSSAIIYQPDSISASEDDLLLDDIKILLTDGRHGIEQIARLVRSLKTFSRPDHNRCGSSVSDLIEQALVLTNFKIKYVAEVIKNYAPSPLIHCARSEIGQVFVNLIYNAAQAVEGRERDGRIVIDTEPYGTTMVRVRISDNGQGIPKDVLPKIFDPFFSTKPVGEGTGLGLSICYRIVQSHGGRIEVESSEGDGSVFSVILPIEESAPSPSRSETADPQLLTPAIHTRKTETSQ